MMTNKNITLILGGARSGKSRLAEKFALNLNLTPIYLATGEARDSEMAARIAAHKEDRGQRWKTIEEPLNVGKILHENSENNSVILVDCLTLWLSNLFEHGYNIEEQIDQLIEALKSSLGPVVLVSNDVGQGIVPTNELARNFRDESGRLNQKIAAIAQNVYSVTAGLPIPLKEDNKPLTGTFS